MLSLWLGCVVVLGVATSLMVRRTARTTAHRALVSWIVTVPVVLVALFATLSYRTEIEDWSLSLLLFRTGSALITLACGTTLSNVASSAAFSWREPGPWSYLSLVSSVTLAVALIAGLEFVSWFYFIAVNFAYLVA